MHVRVSVFDPSWGAVEPIDLELDAPTGTPWSLVAPRVSKVLAAQGRCVPVDATFRAGRRLAPEDRLGLDPLVHGALLVVDGGSVSGAGAPAGRGLLELHVVGGHGAGRVVCLGRGTHLLGRAASCAVRLDDPGASRAHAALTVGESGIHLRDLNPTNRSTVGASPLPREGAVLAPGDRVRVASTTVALRRMPDPSPRRPARDGRVPIHRPPRIGARRAPVQIVFPDPAPGPRAPQLPLVALLAPLVVSGLLALGLHAVTMLLFGLLSPLLLLGQWAGDRRQGRRAHRRQSEQHARRTAEARARLDVALAAEAAERDRDHPDLATMAVVARQRAPSLWCRHPGDDNHLVVRLGTATQPAVLTVSGGGVAAPSVDHAPAVVSLRDVGVLGLTGPRGVALSLAGAVVAQLATWQSPREVRIAVLADSPDAERDWCWAAWLPHWLPLASAPTMPSPGSPGRADTVGHPKDGPDELATWVEGRRAGRAMSGAPEPELVVVLDGAQTLRGHAGVAGLLQHGPAMGVHIVCIATHHDELPPETSACLTLGSDGSSAALMGPTSTLDGIIPDLPTAGWLEAHARSLAPLEDAAPRHQEGTVPAHVGFRALHRADRVAPCDPVDASSVAARWSAHAGAARAVLGTAATGPYALDLATDGPHLLVGGTTGSGKSELLRTLVTSLAVSTPPDALSFVLVDYKGGAAFRDCARLPHTVGLVTDLDEHLTRRALSSLDAELRRRERLFASVGAADLAGYDRLRRADSLRIPRMVLVVDEFKLLADDLPGFVAGLVRIAAVGRSLGVHLVLATQRPAGIITGDMRANVQLRIALRMRDRGDSLDVVDGPEAAALSERFPGRALVRGAGDRLVELQTAQISARFEDAPDSGADVAVRLAAGGDSRTPSAAAPPGGRGADDGADDSELAAVVSAVQEAAVAAGVHAGPAPWLPPLPHRLGLPGLTDRSTSGRATVPATSIPVGLADLPALQQQDVFTWDPDASGHLGIAGGPRSGRTSALTTLALGIAERYGPHQVHIHILEGVPGALSDLAGLPHVGSVTGASDPARARRAVDRLCQQLDRSAEDVSRLTVVLVDGWEAVQDSLDRLDHGATTDRLVRLMRDGLSSGLRVVVTGGRALTGGRLVPLVQQRLVLPLPDPLDLALVGLDRAAAPTPWPPGRAVHATTGLEIQLAYAGAPAGKTVTPLMQSARSAEERWSWLPPEVLPWRLRELPTRVTLREVPSRPPPHLAIGVGEEEGSSLGFDPSRGERRILVAGGRRTGRSTALHALAMRLLEQHHPLIVVTVRPSCLTAGAARTCSGVVAAGDQPIAGTRLHLLGPGEVDRFVELRRAVPHAAIIVDDAESLDGSPMADALAGAARLVETAGGVIAAAVDVARQPVAFRGLVAEVARDSTGLLLCPTATSDGDLFRLAAEAVTHRIPGRGLHILARQVTPIHIADAA